jgi:starch-binding outer membrane protein, SusD/RagB family
MTILHFSKMRRAAVVVALGVLAGCNADRLNIPSFNDPAVGPSDRPLLQNLASGMIAEQRGGMAGLISNVGIFGRESYNYTGSEPRNVTFFLLTFPLDNSGFTNGQWDPRFRNIRNALNFITVVDGAGFLSDGEKNAARGFANTMRALDLFYVIATRDTLGAPTALDVVNNTAQPFVSRDSVYRYISGTLDLAAQQLTAAGATAFPFTLPAGFAGFTTPATFRQFNRALAARIQVYRGSLGCGATCFTAALTALGESFIASTAGADLRRGVYHTYSTASGDALNALNNAVSPDVLAHPSIRPDAQLQSNGQPDARVAAKIRTLNPIRNAPGTNLGIPTDVAFSIYPDQTTPVPIIRNEELILLRAEANIGLGNLAVATTDLNFVRSAAGSLPALATPANADAAVTALLYERRYSLLFEGHRWFDTRRYRRINTLPLDLPNHFRVTVMPVPQAECVFRATLETGLRGPGC